MKFFVRVSVIAFIFCYFLVQYFNFIKQITFFQCSMFCFFSCVFFLLLLFTIPIDSLHHGKVYHVCWFWYLFVVAIFYIYFSWSYIIHVGFMDECSLGVVFDYRVGSFVCVWFFGTCGFSLLSWYFCFLFIQSIFGIFLRSIW